MRGLADVVVQPTTVYGKAKEAGVEGLFFAGISQFRNRASGTHYV